MANYTKRDQRRSETRDELTKEPVKPDMPSCPCGNPAKYAHVTLDFPSTTKFYCDTCLPEDLK